MTKPSHAFFGERYYYEAYVPLCVLGGRGLLVLGAPLSIAPQNVRKIITALVILIFFSFLRFMTQASSWPQLYKAIQKAVAQIDDAVVYIAPARDMSQEILTQTVPNGGTHQFIIFPIPGIERRRLIAASLDKSRSVVGCYDVQANSAFICYHDKNGEAPILTLNDRSLTQPLAVSRDRRTASQCVEP